ncbi:hypothetical protein ACHAXR_006068 [Thalassiosira sp. AJA248-18]
MTNGNDDDEISLNETLATLTLVLKKKQQALEEREIALEKATATLNRDRSEVFGDKAGSDVLHLNIGGDRMAVLRRTLTSVEGSMLASRFSGRWDESLEKDKEGNFFIDQPVELFRPMINYLRAKACETDLAPPIKSPHLKDYESRQDFYRLVEYFGMTPGIYPTVIELHRGEPGSAEIGSFPDCYVKCNEWSTFTCQTLGHKREITSFEVVLGNVERMQIGWINESRYVENLSNDNRNGVGEEENSVALDCCRGGLLVQGEYTNLEGLSIGTGSVIRCEQKGHRWMVDGKIVVSSIASDEVRHFENSFLPPTGHVNNGEEDKIIPCFSGKGVSIIFECILFCATF